MGYLLVSRPSNKQRDESKAWALSGLCNQSFREGGILRREVIPGGCIQHTNLVSTQGIFHTPRYRKSY